MKSFALFAAACAVVLSAGGTKTANAATLDFDFSFSNQSGNFPGTVTGEINGLSDNSTGPASAVLLDSFPAALGSICSTPCNTTASPWTVGVNLFNVSNGQITSTINFFSFLGTTAISFGPGSGALVSGGNVLAGPATFSPVPLPAALPLFATGLGGLGLFGWLRKRKSRAATAIT